MTRYDPEEGVAYGVCLTCDLSLESQEAARAHMDQTMTPDSDGNRRSHTTQALNPSREERVRTMVRNVVQDAIQDALDNLEDEVDRGWVTDEEVAAGLKFYADFADEWENKS